MDAYRVLGLAEGSGEEEIKAEIRSEPLRGRAAARGGRGEDDRAERGV